MSSSDLELIETLRNLSKTQDLWAAGTAAGRLEDLLAVLVKETCRCGRTDESDPAKHYDGLGLDGRPTACRYRQLVEPAKAKWTKLDQIENIFEQGLKPTLETNQKLIRLARVAVEGFRLRSRYHSTSEILEQQTREREALRDIDPRLIGDE